MRTDRLRKKVKKIMELRDLLRQEAIKKYNELDKETQLNLQKQYDIAKYDSKIQKMGARFEDFLRFMLDLKISVRRAKSGELEYEIKPENKPKIIIQRAQNLVDRIRGIEDDYSINLNKYKNGEISLKQFGLIYRACRKSLSIKQRELNKLQKFSKSSKTCFS
jgi:hypothetical protein